MENFVAIDFETANNYRNSACAVGIVTVTDNVVTDEYYTLIQPPLNQYNYHNILVHGIRPEDTIDAPTFDDIYFEIKHRLQNQIVVAHNEAFDRSVLKHTMEFYGLNYSQLNLSDRWECTYRIFKLKGIKPTKLSDCARKFNLQLNHHEALSDAKVCAQLYLLK
ncbi:3'-5' exonuclease [Empedobacter stercoris]|uniref:3'-5' exonuclease n=1 Tax=Empedobacter stercoris TaxID=1628248 RepID=A0ABX1WJK3_9FLAO|nr:MULTISPECIES: 3'-5' exonuclease [Empedobacter]MCA4776562.1 3'-5' exonuclease [Empedobacter stercoris]MCA4782037.1 3'-5' exonuclease [Empedobacter stercoris]MCA4808976.1 3'-5' exonuclease [Empedobacter stercoris]MDM1521942.1 3'-5' exonuclease [Empedobacter sp. 225-1]NOJ74790.1 3'-5' exonuclease [Empedobacter stercoris]